MAALAVLPQGCDRYPTQLQQPVDPSQTSASNPGEGPVTTSAREFVDRVEALGNDNEILVVLKDRAESPRAAAFLRSQSGALGAIAVPASAETDGARNGLGMRVSDDRSAEAVRQLLKDHEIEPYASHRKVLALRLPHEAVSVVAALLSNPHVDYLEANRPIGASWNEPSPLLADPVGSNPTDEKHDFHNVEQAWDITRGYGAVVGVLDSGFAYDLATGQWHRDGQLLNPDQGIEKRGFVDDYTNIGDDCSPESGHQPYGWCLPRDDHGHGTRMVGIVGANDNALDYVGIMPEGLTISMKVSQDCGLTGGCGSSTEDFMVENDDLLYAVLWAADRGVDVVSMSFSSPNGRINESVKDAMYLAYHDYDVLLLSSTDDANHSEPQAFPYVVGVGAVTSQGNDPNNYAHQELYARGYGGTTSAVCLEEDGFCYPGGNTHSGGTSTATAIVAGIAGLVRSNEHTLSASELRSRLATTSTGTSVPIVDAYRAVANIQDLSVSIVGDDVISVEGWYTWEAMPQHGTGAYTYQWEYREEGTFQWLPVGTQKTYRTWVLPTDADFNLRVTVTSGTEQAAAVLFVQTAENCGGLPC